MPPRAPPVAVAGAEAWSSGSGPVLFEPGLTGTVLQRIAPAPSEPVQRLKGNRTRIVATVCAIPVWNDPLQQFRLNRCNHSDFKLRICPS